MKNKTKIIIIIILLIVVIAVIVGGISAKYLTTMSGSVGATVATMICETQVNSYNSTVTNINPYCQVSVKNYNSNNQITQTSVNYTVYITSLNNEELPEYYCLDSNGIEVANSAESNFNIVGTLGCEQTEEDIYTVYFINAGETNFTQNLKFETKAVQQQ